jgi:hypothetical protein
MLSLKSLPLFLLCLLAACNPPASTVSPTETAIFTPVPTAIVKPTSTATLEPTATPPSLPAEFAAQFDQDSYTVVQNADGVWVARNNADGLALMTYDSAAKKWQLPELFSGLPPTVAEFPKIADSDPLIALLVQKDRALAEADGFFQDNASEVQVLVTPNGIKLVCATDQTCMIDMESFSRDVQTENGIVTQFFIIRAIKVPVTEKTPTGVVVWSCFLGENPTSHGGLGIGVELGYAKVNVGRRQMDIWVGRSNSVKGTSFEMWFDNPDFAAELEKMRKDQQIWNLDQPMPTWIRYPDFD